MKLEAQTFCEALWRGQTRRFALALCDGFIHFWEPDSAEFQEAPEEWVWVVEGEVPPRLGLRDARFPLQVNHDFLVSTFRGALQDRRVGRSIHWSENQRVLLHLNGSGSVVVVMEDERHNAKAPFRFEGTNEVLNQNYSFWLGQLHNWANEEESDFSFALSWLFLSDAARFERLVELGAGDWQELSQVADWILTLEGHDCMSWSAAPLEVTLRLHCADEKFLPRVSTEDEDLLMDREFLWEVWLRAFNPCLFYETTERYTAANSFAQSNFTWTQWKLSRLLSAHEQIEVRLLLRDWLRERAGVSDERINELLR